MNGSLTAHWTDLGLFPLILGQKKIIVDLPLKRSQENPPKKKSPPDPPKPPQKGFWGGNLEKSDLKTGKITLKVIYNRMRKTKIFMNMPI